MAETLNTFEEQAPDEAHEQAMLEKGEQLEQSASPERPEWLPEKFKNAEDMANAYAELEQKLGQQQQEEQTKEPKEYDNTDDAEASQVAQALDNVGLDFNVFQDEYAETGELSPDAYNALEEKGFNRELVDSWIAGQEALASKTTNQIYDMAGGEEQYSGLVQWASENLSESEIDAYNANVESGDLSLAQFAVSGLVARYRSEVGNEPQLVQGDNASSSSGAFQSVAELTAAMRDPRYNNDPAYRKSVADELSRSKVF